MAPMAAIAEARISQGRRRWIRGAIEARDTVKKTGEQPSTALPQFYFMLLYQAERLLIVVLHKGLFEWISNTFSLASNVTRN